MKKIKVTKRPGTNFTLRPSRARMFLVYLIIMTIAIGASLLYQYIFGRGSFAADWFQKEGIIYLAVIVGGAVLITLFEYSRWVLRVDNGDKVEGPSGVFRERLVIPIKEIDWKRTRRNLGSWFKFGNAIYSVSRRRILVTPWFFDPAQFREFLRLIGYEKQSG